MSTTKTVIIDEVAALDALRKTVEKYGSETRLTSTCTYSEPEGGWLDYNYLDEHDRDTVQVSAPNCMIGCALHDVIGVPLETLRLLDSSANGGYCDAFSDKIRAEKTLAVLTSHGVSLTPVALDIWEVAQDVQDNGKEWGYALAKAEAYAELLKTGEQNDGTEGSGATA